MATFPRYPCLLAAGLVVLVTACIPIDLVWRNAQDVSIEVTETASGSPVANARVIYQPMFDRYFVEPVLTEDADASLFVNAAHMTSPSGQALLPLWSPGGCSTPGILLGSCDILPDKITGARYLLRVDTGIATELLSVDIVPGARVVGDVFTIAVVSVASPRSIPYP